jgi:hypothetical protein
MLRDILTIRRNWRAGRYEPRPAGAGRRASAAARAE